MNAEEALTDLTFDEAEVLAEKLEKAADTQAVKSEFETVYRSCTLARTNRTAKSTSGAANEASPEGDLGATTWKMSCEEDRTKIRLR